MGYCSVESETWGSVSDQWVTGKPYPTASDWVVLGDLGQTGGENCKLWTNEERLKNNTLVNRPRFQKCVVTKYLVMVFVL